MELSFMWSFRSLEHFAAVEEKFQEKFVPCNLLQKSKSYMYEYTHSILTAIFPVEPGLSSCPLNSPSPFIPGVRVLLGQA